jgi:hypothetical protein
MACVLNVVSGEIKVLIKVDKSDRRYSQQLLVADAIDASIYIHGWHLDNQLHQSSLLAVQRINLLVTHQY